MLHNRLLSRTGSITIISILCGMLLLLIGIAGSQSHVRAQNNNGIVESDGLLLNVRNGPGSDYTILHQLEDQDVVEILDLDSTGNWYEISFEGEFTDVGWVFAAYIRQLEDGTDVIESQSHEQASVAESNQTDFATLPIEERAIIVIERLELAATEVARIVETATAASDTSAQVEGTPTPQPTGVLQSSDDERAAAADARSEFAVTVVARAQIAKTEIAKILGTATSAAREESTPEPTPTDDKVESEESSGEESSRVESSSAAATVIERMNLYRGPGTHYTVLATVEAGSIFDIIALDAKGLWYQVQPEGLAETVWVYSGLVELTGDVETLPRILETIPTRIPQATPTQVAVADPDVSPTPTIRPLMEASDPASFEVASGQVQVVEFFGFW